MRASAAHGRTCRAHSAPWELPWDPVVLDASAAANPDAEDLVVPRTSRGLVGQLPVADRRRVVELRPLAVPMDRDGARLGILAVIGETDAAVVRDEAAHSGRQLVSHDTPAGAGQAADLF